MAFWRSILNTPAKDGFGSTREFIRRAGLRVPVHLFEHLKQTPTLAPITFRVQDAFSLEIHIIDKRVASLWCFCQA